jgi:multidrug resistance efflux pump
MERLTMVFGTTVHQDHPATLLLRPSLAQTKSISSALFWDMAQDSSRQRLVRKRQLRRQQQQQQQNADKQQQHQQPKEEENNYRAKAEVLQKELDMAQATIQRWEAVLTNSWLNYKNKIYSNKQ